MAAGSAPSWDAELDRSCGALLGLAVGDALGAPVEGRARGSYPRLVDYLAGGTHDLAAGEWTDDTALAICLAESLLARGRLDERDALERFLRWYRAGENGCGGRTIGISERTRRTLEDFERSRDLAAAARVGNDGNGCIMRLAPIAIFHRADAEMARDAAARQARLTHTADTAIAATQGLVTLLLVALEGGDRDAVLARALREHGSDFRSLPRDAVSAAPRAHDTLEAALWCISRADDFEAILIEAVNLGGDADTIGAVAGQLAGAIFGASAIPARWRSGLYSAEQIGTLATRLHRNAG
jgi:ADP-ribosyl-[dinitrogen reductase] hydrolase